MRDCPEINLCNYNDDDVVELNQWAVEAIDENALLRDYVDAKDSLLACYRVGKRPTERLLKRLEKLKAILYPVPASA